MSLFLKSKRNAAKVDISFLTSQSNGQTAYSFVSPECIKMPPISLDGGRNILASAICRMGMTLIIIISRVPFVVGGLCRCPIGT